MQCACFNCRPNMPCANASLARCPNDAVLRPLRPDSGSHRASADAPHMQPLPGPWQQQPGHFARLLLVQLLRPQAFVAAVAAFVAEHLGHAFVEPEPWTLDSVFQETSCGTPIMLILSPGAVVRCLVPWTSIGSTLSPSPPRRSMHVQRACLASAAE